MVPESTLNCYVAFHFFAQRQRSATRVLGAGRASARHVTSIRVGCSAWLGLFLLGQLIIRAKILRSKKPKPKTARFEKRILRAILCDLGLKCFLRLGIVAPQHRPRLAIEKEVPYKDDLTSSDRETPAFWITVRN